MHDTLMAGLVLHVYQRQRFQCVKCLRHDENLIV